MSRLDRVAVERGIAKSRERAKEYIAEGRIFVNGKAVTKPSAEVSDTDEITLSGEEMRYVGRGGLKLEKALNEFKIDVSGLTAQKRSMPSMSATANSPKSFALTIAWYAQRV